jgi:K+-sensing histidine kinase KdpD
MTQMQQNEGQLEFIGHEFNAAREGLRRCIDQINMASKGNNIDFDRLRANISKLIEQYDALDVLFELLRIEVNPDGLDTLSPIDHNIHSMFYRALTHYAYRMKKKKITFKLEQVSSLHVIADPSLSVIPFLLLDNAVKYAPTASYIYIGLDDVDLTASLESVGPCILPNETEAIFSKGFQGANAKLTKAGGKGIGLYIVKKICDKQGFQIKVSQESPVSLGGIPFASTKFTINFSKVTRR